MVMGAVLTQPQRMQRAVVTDPAVSLISDLTSLAARLAQDLEQGGQLAEVTRTALNEALFALIAQKRGTLQSLAPRLADWLLRVVRATTGIGPELTVGSPADALQLLQGLLNAVASAAEAPSAARIRPYVAELLGIVQNDLGLSLPAVEQAFWNAVGTIIERLEAMPAEASRTTRENRLDTIRLLRRIRQLVRGRFPLPTLDADRIAAAFAASLTRVNARGFARQARCVAEKLGTVNDAASALERLAPLGAIGGFRSLGAAAAVASGETFCWYASWLQGADVVINASKTQIRKGDEVIREGTDLSIAHIPFFEATTTPRYVFPRISLDALEKLSFAAFVMADGIVLICHLASIEEGDLASNALNVGFTTITGMGKLIVKSPLLSSGVEDWVFPLIGSFLGSFQGIHTKSTFLNGFTMWITLFLPDFIEAVIYKQASVLARDFLLSLFTLINYEGTFEATGASDVRPLNKNHIDGVAFAGEWLGSFIFFRIFPRDEYAQPFVSAGHALKQLLFWDLFLYSLFYFLGRLVGCALAMGVARTFDFGTWMKPVPLALLKNYFVFFISLYLDKEGDTNDGRYNPTGADYAGYPPRESSPYVLPYPKDNTCYVIQGNQGMFSHHHLNIDQTYAYDFSLDQDDPILAARPGTVVDYFDWVPDDTNPDSAEEAAARNEASASGFLVSGQTTSHSWNFIIIRHDVDDAGNALAPDSTHDKAAGGTVVQTYAVYGHGRKDSVRDSFSARGIAANNIIGTKVKQGQRIMRSGDTGISFNNHLHMMVQEGPAASTPAPVASTSLLDPSLPFVFREFGVLKRLDWYTSKTEETT